LGRSFWKDSVDKMISKYGARVPADQIESLADYLVKAYGIESTNASAPAVTESAQTKPESTGTFDVTTYVANGCAPCHDGKVPTIPAPLFKDVARKYQGRADAIDKVSHQILNGGAGQWGTFPMPAFTDIKPDEVKKLADWILAQK
jgi:cytochrome c551/c552